MSAPTARERLAAKADELTLQQAVHGLLLLDSPKSDEEMIVRIALISSIEKRFPAVAEWVADFYSGDDDDPRWDVEYSGAILLACDELGLELA